MRRKPVVWAVSLTVLIFLPVTLFGLMLSVNEYEDQGISGAVDCNGPLGVMMVVAPSLVVYAAGAVYYALLLRGVRRTLWTSMLMVLCTVMAFAAGRKAWAAYGENYRPVHQETCGKGW